MRAHRGKRGCKRSCRTSATGQPRQTSNARAGVEVGWRVEPALSLDQRRRTEDGAPYDVWGTFPHRNYTVRYPTQGASGTPPPTVVARFRFQRSREVQFIKSVTFFYAASSVTLPPVGCTVLGAPWLRDCRVSLAADVRLDRFYPRHPRCASLASTAQRMKFRGHSPRTIGRCEGAHPLRHIPQASLRTRP